MRGVIAAAAGIVGGWGRKVSAAGQVISLYRAGNPQWSGRNYLSFSEQGYKKCVVAYRCIHLLASSMAAVEWILRDGDREIMSHKSLDLLHQPNPWEGGAEFFERQHAFELISGNGWMEQVFTEGPPPGETVIPIPSIGVAPVQLFSARPDRMTIVPSAYATPARYRYGAAGNMKEWAANPFGNDSAMIHFKRFNPTDDFFGMSPLEAAAYAVDQHNEAGAWNMSLLQNSGRPSGALVYAPKGQEGSEMPETMFQRLKKELVDSHQGPSNAGRPMVLDGGLSWLQMALSPQDMDWINGKHVSAREICLAFGVPPYLMGIPGDATYNNYKEARQGMYEDTILPLLDRHCDKLNVTLIPRFGGGGRLRLTYNEDSIAALAPKRAEKWTAVQNATWLTTNEKREATGYEPIGPEGDEVLVPSTMVPLSLAGDPTSDMNNPPPPTAPDPEAADSESSKKVVMRQLVREGYSTSLAKRIAGIPQ